MDLQIKKEEGIKEVNSMKKKIFSNLLLIFAYPFKLLKKSKFDNFVGGIIFGASVL